MASTGHAENDLDATNNRSVVVGSGIGSNQKTLLKPFANPDVTARKQVTKLTTANI
jgi:hypothetical protein